MPRASRSRWLDPVSEPTDTLKSGGRPPRVPRPGPPKPSSRRGEGFLDPVPSDPARCAPRGRSVRAALARRPQPSPQPPAHRSRRQGARSDGRRAQDRPLHGRLFGPEVYSAWSPPCQPKLHKPPREPGAQSRRSQSLSRGWQGSRRREARARHARARSSERQTQDLPTGRRHS